MTSEELRERQVAVYRHMGFRVTMEEGPDAVAFGPNDVPWYIFGADTERLADPAFEQRLDEMRETRHHNGDRPWLCPIDVVVDAAGQEAAEAIMRRLRLDRTGHVNVYTATD